MGMWRFAKSLLTRAAGSLETGVFWGGASTSSGEIVTSDSAMRVSAVYTCVRILAYTLATMPLNIYKRVGEGGRVLATDHPLYSLLRLDKPNPIQNNFDFKLLMQMRLVLLGNAYAYIEFDGRGKIKSLRPLCPDYVTPIETPTGELVYRYTSSKGSTIFLADEILHLRGMSSNGLVGLSPIEQMMEVIGTSMAMDKHGAASFANGARLGGVLKYPGKLDQKAIKNIRESWQTQHAGSANSGKTAILEQGMDYATVGMSNEQAQWLEGMKFKRSEIAGIFQVPPHMIGDLERATFSNIEQQSLEFIQFTMLPWITLWETAIGASLFSKAEQSEYFAKFNVNVFLRGDGLARAQKLQIERMNGIISANEWRAYEELNPIDGEAGDKYLVPMNMADANDPSPDHSTDSGGQPPRTPGSKQQEPASTDSNLNRAALRPIIEAALKRIVTKEFKSAEGKQDILAWCSTFAPANNEMLIDTTLPIVHP